MDLHDKLTSSVRIYDKLYENQLMAERERKYAPVQTYQAPTYQVPYQQQYYTNYAMPPQNMQHDMMAQHQYQPDPRQQPIVYQHQVNPGYGPVPVPYANQPQDIEGRQPSQRNQLKRDEGDKPSEPLIEF